MSYLINRTPVARIKCLHNIMRLINANYDKNSVFHMGNIQFDLSQDNIHNYCDLLINDYNLKIKYCPYLDNPLSESGCNLTNGVLLDTTKKKEVSNTINSLEALGFIVRNNRDLKITDFGIEFAKTDFNNTSMHSVLQKAVLNYGPCIGVLAQLLNLNREDFITSDIHVGYPVTGEQVKINNDYIIISTGSQKDSNTRTRSTLLSWCTSAGFIMPIDYLSSTIVSDKSHIHTLDYSLSKSRNIKNYKLFKFPNYIFNDNFIVNNPLDYDNFTKNTGALRENGQKVSREATMKFESKIKNRRLAIVYLLNKCYILKKSINFNDFIIHLSNLPDIFVIDIEELSNVMSKEIFFAYMCGIPFKVDSNKNLIPMVGLNEEVICKNAPLSVINYLDKFNKFV